jgi:hypothetical protein
MRGVKKKLLKVKKTKGPKVKDEKGVKESFAYILKSVEDGWTITEAAELAKVNKTALYKFITAEQKALLWQAKTTHTKYGAIAKASLKKKEDGKKASAGKQEDGVDDFRDLILERPEFEVDWDD